MTPDEAYEKALNEGPSDETRKIILEDPNYSFFYANVIDRCPRDDTRKAVCKDAFVAYHYALIIDKHPRDDTRKAACQNSRSAYEYAKNVDGRPTKETWIAVKNTKFEELYCKLFGISFEELDDVFLSDSFNSVV